MTKWIECQSAINPSDTILINLDHVAAIYSVGQGCRARIIGSKDEIAIANSKASVLQGIEVRRVW